jgi:hypothetical protein
MVAKFEDRLALSKQTMHRLHMEIISFKILSEVHGKDQYHVGTSNRFAGLENLDAELIINSAWETRIFARV